MSALAITSLGISEALLIALSGLVTVFLMLACLCVIIVVISRVVGFINEKASGKDTPVEVASAPVVTEKTADDNTYGGEIKLIDVDEKTAACIMAIVSDETGIPLSELVFKKIRAI